MTATENPTIEPSWTLNQVISAKPGLATRMESMGLDYCCHGEKTIDFAAKAAGLDPVEVANKLNHEASPHDSAPWITMSLTQLVDHIVGLHHQFLWEQLPRLSALMAKVHMVHGENHPELAETRQVFEAIRAELEPHLSQEEKVVFPRIKQLDAAQASNGDGLDTPISALVTEHEAAGELLERLRELTNQYQPPADGCASYQALFAGLEQLALDTHLHIHKENHRLFPGAIEREKELSAAKS